MNIYFKTICLTIIACLLSNTNLFSQPQIAKDDFEGNGTINTWFGDNCLLDTSFNNPYQTGINTSSKVLKYADVGGQYANVRFDATFNFNLSISSKFSFKLYVPSNGITGNAPNQISLKLQNGSLPTPWSTQCEIIKPIVLNQWQVITFDFATEPYINLDPNSLSPIDRQDFNRVLIQINGENNNANVLAFIDDFSYISAYSAYKDLVWSDEFDNNGAVNNANWFHQTQLPDGFNWYNGELQHYTNSQSNSFVANGNLNIVAKKETFTSQGQTKQYTSARLNSKFAFKYGRVEVRAKLATGAGTWPAIWMLGKNINEPGGYWAPTHGSKNWPACGEIDIMEHWGTNQNVISSAVHFPVNGNLNVGQYVTNAQYKAGVSSDFHIYAVEWNEQKIVFSVDGINHLTYNPSVKNQYTWPFNEEQYILLNVAIEPSVANNFTQSAMEIDYVRVYQNICSSSISTTNISTCGSYTWNGVTYTNSGTYTKTFTGGNSKGCDSTAMLNLTINQATLSTTNKSICPSELPYSWNGNSYTSSGSYTIHLTNAGGCDSSATLNLSIKPSALSNINATTGATASTIGLCNIGNETLIANYTAPNGTWNTNNSNVATVTPTSSFNRVAKITATGVGTATVTYIVTSTSGCLETISTLVHINPQASPSAIVGNATTCIGVPSTYSSSPAGGVWSAARGTFAGNSYTPSSAGTVTVTYKVTNAAGCSASASKNITNYAIPATPSISFTAGTTGITGSGGYCKNRTFTLVGTPANGVWDNSGVISINPSGTSSSTTVVNTGNVTGAFGITYTTNANGCSSKRTITGNIVACSPRGVNGLQSTVDGQQLVIYPNPAHNVISVKVDKLMGAGNIVVTDLYGKQLKTQALSMGSNTIDVSNFAKGMYMVTIITDQGKQTQKVVVE